MPDDERGEGSSASNHEIPASGSPDLRAVPASDITRLNPVLAAVLSALMCGLVYYVTIFIAAFLAGRHFLLFEAIFRTTLSALLLALFVWLLTVFDHLESGRLAALGLPLIRGGLWQFAQGCLVGFLLVSLCVIPLAVFGRDEHVALHLQWSLLSRIVVVLVLLVMGALAEELMFRGYPFQRLVEGIGPVGAVVVFSIIFGAMHFANPGASFWGLLNTVFIGILLAIVYLRTRSLWMPWGIHFAWNFTLGFVFGLPVSGLHWFNVVVRSSVQGPQWLTGGSYGIEASATGAIVVLAGVAFVSRWPVRRLVLPAPPATVEKHFDSEMLPRIQG